jgi:hypothetical protein
MFRSFYASLHKNNIKKINAPHFSTHVYPIICLLGLGAWIGLSWYTTPEFIGQVWASAFVIALVTVLRLAENGGQGGGRVHP